MPYHFRDNPKCKLKTKDRILKLKQGLLKVGVTEEEFQKEIANSVGIIALSARRTAKLSSLSPADYWDYMDVEERHVFAERLNLDLTIWLAVLVSEDRK